MATIRRRRRPQKKEPAFAATCSVGLETLVAGEISLAGGRKIRTGRGVVQWRGSLETGYRACLWSRFASRILLELARFPAPDTDTLYRHIREMDWEEHFAPEQSFAVRCTLSDAAIHHSRFAVLRVKDGIVDYFRDRTGKRPSVDVDTPDIRVNLHLAGEQATVSLDLSGESLHRRGYRKQATEAPLKESLAAAICTLAGISPQCARPIILDPMCGSGTLLIEAALIIGDSAPGLQRRGFGFERWRLHRPKLWQKLVQEALAREEKGWQRPWPVLLGSDADPAAVAAARANIEAAGLADRITVEQAQLARLAPPGPDGLLLTNPPYGVRLSEKLAVKYLYRFLAQRFSQRFDGWKLGLFSAHPDLLQIFHLSRKQHHFLFNGPLKCSLLTGRWQRRETEEPARLSLHEHGFSGGRKELANRLAKNWRHLHGLAKKQDVFCFRLYDRDLPQYNLIIDVYECWLHVQEYAPPSSIDPDKAATRFKEALDVLRTLFGLKRHQLFIKTRRRQRGKKQYQREKTRERLYEVREGGARFLVNLTDYLDTGLFLDHRITRDMVGKMAAGKTFLNLFGYTGSATVYAAMHGALATTTVDASETYLARARANLALNGFGGAQHVMIQADCLQWLRSCRKRFGVIFVDPPTFSNARHARRTFSVQEDHAGLLELALRCLSRTGTLVFSTNYRKFELDETLARRFEVRDITGQTIPFDFTRRPPVHRCFTLRHRQETDSHEQSSRNR